jgi:hypothetical protein
MVHPEGVLKKYLPESAYKGTVKAKINGSFA